MLAHLPERIETFGLDSPQCPACGQALNEFPATEDSEVLEIEVKVYRHLIRRRRYRPSCQCRRRPAVNGQPTAQVDGAEKHPDPTVTRRCGTADAKNCRTRSAGTARKKCIARCLQALGARSAQFSI